MDSGITQLLALKKTANDLSSFFGMAQIFKDRLLSLASLLIQTVKNQPAMQETQVQSLVWEDPLEEGMATHCSILALRIPWAEEPGGLQPGGTKSQT